MKVLHVLWTAHFGGIERLALDLARAQARSSNLEVSVLFGRAEGEMLDLYRNASVPFEDVGLHHGFDFSPAKYRKMKQIFSKQDVLHLHTFIPVMARAAAASSASIVYTEHGNFGYGRGKAARDYLKEWLLKRFLSRDVDFLSFNSRFTRAIAEERYPLASVQREVIYNGIDLTSQRNGPADLTAEIRNAIEGKFVVGTCSRFAGFKRIDRLIEAFSSFARHRDAVLLLVGDGPLRTELGALAGKLEIADKVIFAGYQQDVRPYQQAMNVCVFPSQSEPFGLAAIETLLLGKPTIVLKDAGGMAEIIEGCNSADVVDDVVQLGNRLEHYFECRDDVNECLIKSRVDHARKFDIGTMAETFGGIYENVTK